MIKTNVGLEDVKQVYDGPVGKLWEMLMGEEIHVGGPKETDVLAQKAGVTGNTRILDVCSALGGPARHLAKRFGCQVTGLDATQTMHEEAILRTKKSNLDNLVDFRLGDALEVPFAEETFDVVWGQDAWCYLTDKKRLIKECHRVLKPGGIIAFTDWLNKKAASVQEQRELLTFMVFPYLETLSGYENLLKDSGFEILEKEDLSDDFTNHILFYQSMLQDLKDTISQNYGTEMFEAAEKGVALWARASQEKKVSRGRIVGRKVSSKQSYH